MSTALIALTVATALASASTLVVAAAPTASSSCEVVHIAATSSGTIAPDLKPFESKLKKPPFSSWRGFKVRSRATLTVGATPVEFSSTGGIKTRLTLEKIVAAPAKKARLAYRVTITTPQGSPTETRATLDEGDTLLLARDTQAPAALVVAVTCRR